MLRVLVVATPPTTITASSPGTTDDRELVCFAGLCNSPTHERCQCDSSFLILRTRVSGITTAEVSERDMTLEDYVNAFVASYVVAGFPGDDETLAFASREAIRMHRLAAEHPVGTVVEVRGDRVHAYRPTSAD